MGIIGSAALSFGVNILTNISVSVSSFAKNKIKQKKLFNVISDFNSKFENTVIDTKAFGDIIESEEFSEDIYNYIFRNTSVTMTEDHFIAKKANEIVKTINKKNEIYGRLPFEDTEIVISYLTELIHKLNDFKNEYFNTEELALLSSINNLITENREIIIEEVKGLFKLHQLDNEFAENIIDNLITSNLNFEFEMADKIYNQLITNKEQLSNFQFLRVAVEYSKTCAYRDDFKKISDIIEQINSLPTSEKYVYEINYIKSLKLNDIDSLNEDIEYFKSQNYSKEIIALKKCEIQYSLGDLEQIKIELLDQDDNLKINFSDFPEAHFFRGLYLNSLKGILDNEDFVIAYSQKKSLLYEFYISLITIKKYISNNELEILKDVYTEIFKFENLLKYFSKQEHLNYWLNYLHLDSILNLNKLDYIEKKLLENNFYNLPHLIEGLAEAFARQNNFPRALEIVELVSPKTNFSQIFLFNFLFELEYWDRILSEYKHLESLYDHPDVRLIYLFAESKTKNIENYLDEILDFCKKQNDIPSYYKTIKFFSAHAKEHFTTLLNIIKENIFYFDLEAQSFLLNLIYRNNYSDEVKKIILTLPELNDFLVSMVLSTLELSEENLDEVKDYRLIIDELLKKHINTELIVYSIQLDLTLKVITKDTFKSIEKLRELKADKAMIAYFNLSAKYFIEDFTEIEEDLQTLLQSTKSHDQILAATILVRTNQIEYGNKLAIETLYTNKDSIDDYLSRNFLTLISYQLGSVHDSSTDAEIDNPNIVLKLRNKNEKISLAIIEENISKVNDYQYTFDAYHLNSNSSKVTKIIAKYKVNKFINYNDVDYELEEIITLKTHLYRYFLDYVINNSPTSKIELLSAENPEDLIAQIQKKLTESHKRGKFLMDFYNFKENITGLPISGLLLDKSELRDYAAECNYLLFNEHQYFYVPMPINSSSENYVLSLSTLLLLNKFNLFKDLDKIKDKLTTPKYIFDRINNMIQNLTKEKEGAKGILNLHGDKLYSQMRDIEIIEAELTEWINILDFIEKISITSCNLTSDTLLNSLSEVLINEDRFAIDLAYENQSCLIIDDLFISKVLPLTKYNNFSINSTFGLIYSEQILDLNQTLDLLNDLIDKKYYFAITANLLYELTIKILSTQESIDEYFSKFYILLRSKICVDPYYGEIIKEFIRLLYINRKADKFNSLFIK
ncbi:hypothetical protein ACIQXG_17725 [Lysinibacillus sphaericus]|uniref:hypothetical protein n=1 Tax=Lysinibacillus sphaericus TaxID=1421 RepID=UPI00382B8212